MAKNPFGCFRTLTGDVDYQTYGGKWWRRVGRKDELRFHIIESINWIEAVGREAEDRPTFNMSLSEVDLLAIPGSALKSALDFVGLDTDTLRDMGEPQRFLAMVEACSAAGASAPLWNEDGNNWWELFRQAVRESRALDDPKAHARAMARTVNKIGSTAREYMQGDLTSALVRGIEAGDPAALLMGKIDRNCGYQTLGGPMPFEEVVRIEAALEGASLEPEKL